MNGLGHPREKLPQDGQIRAYLAHQSVEADSLYMCLFASDTTACPNRGGHQVSAELT